MPLVNVTLAHGTTTPEQRAQIGDGIYRALIDVANVPEGDRFQVFHEVTETNLIYSPDYLGFDRSPSVVFVQIFFNEGRTAEVKKKLYAQIATNLSEAGVRGDDLIINLVEVPKENWSFGRGELSYPPVADTVGAKLAAQGIVLDSVPGVAGSYAPTVEIGDLLFISGQVAVNAEHGLLARGTLGAEVDIDAGIACARQCAINVLTQLDAALGSLDRVRRVVKLTVYVASAPGFVDQSLVANGASDLFNAVFGDIGVHARAAIGVAALPGGSPVEVEAIMRVEMAA